MLQGLEVWAKSHQYTISLFSSLGTILAVGVALWQSRKPTKSKVTANLFLDLADNASPGNHLQWVIQITNHGPLHQYYDPYCVFMKVPFTNQEFTVYPVPLKDVLGLDIIPGSSKNIGISGVDVKNIIVGKLGFGFFAYRFPILSSKYFTLFIRSTTGVKTRVHISQYQRIQMLDS